MSMHQRAMAETPGFFNRKCYGYMYDEEGELFSHPEESKIVQKTFDWYIDGKSVIGILNLLEKDSIPSPRGKDGWPKRTIDEMLSNEKYMGGVILEIEVEPGQYIMMENNHLSIISREKFRAV